MIDVEKLITHVRLKMLMEHAFYGHVIMQLPVVYTTQAVPTLGVGKSSRDEVMTKLYINTDYVNHVVEQCNGNQRRVVAHFFEVLKHEVHHFIFGHLTMQLPDQNRQRIACELSVNSYVNRENLIPEDGQDKAGVFPEDFNLEPRKSMMEYYNLLNGNETYNSMFKSFDQLAGEMEKLAQEQEDLAKQSAKSDGSDKDEIEKRQQEISQKTQEMADKLKGLPGMDKDLSGARSDQGDAEKSLGKNKTGDAADSMQNAADKMRDAAEKLKVMSAIQNAMVDSHDKWKAMEGDQMAGEMVKDIVRQAADVCRQTNKWGDVPGEIMDAIGQCYAQEKEIIPWEVVLKDFLASSSENVLDYTMKRKSKRYDTRPGTKKDDVLSVAIGIDTSGSIDNDLLNLFFNELHWISKTGTKMTVFEWDTQVNREYDFSEFDGKVTGRGGTDPTDFLEKMSERKFDCAIIFTDLYFSDIEKEYGVPLLWVADNDCIGEGGYGGHIPVREGTILKVNKDRDGFEMVER